MTNGFQPAGASLPQPRGVIRLEAAASTPQTSGLGDAIVVQYAQDRLVELINREPFPQDVKWTLAGALNGDLRLQSLLFTAMIDSWPRLQKAIGEVKRAARKAPWKVSAWKPRGQKAKPASEKLASDVENRIWSMWPDPKKAEMGLTGTIEALVEGYFTGHSVLEILWDKGPDFMWSPRATKILPPCYYGYPYEGVDQLMFNKSGSMGAYDYEEFKDAHFLIGVNRGHSGHGSIAAPLRALTAFWVGAVYGLKFLQQYAQVCGIPFRLGKYQKGDIESRNALAKALQDLGSQGWGAFPHGTEIEFKESTKSGNDLPQKILIDLADEQCDIFILGQTLTSSAGDKGSQALGKVHEGVRQDVIAGVCDWVGDILTYQLSRHIVQVNYGAGRTDIPEIYPEWPEEIDFKALAERDKALGIIDGTVPVSEEWFRARHHLEESVSDKALMFPKDATPPPVDPANPDQQQNPPTPPGKATAAAKIAAADASLTWKKFDCDTLDIPRSEMPQIKSGDRSAMVQFLRKRGIESSEETVDPASLKPCQQEYSPEKVDSAKNYTGGNRAILISADDRVIDGHHQWLAAKEQGQQIRAIRLQAQATRILMMVHRMPSTSVAAADASGEVPPSPELESIIDSALEGLTGVAAEWLAPARAIFMNLLELAMSDQVTDDDFLQAIQQAQDEAPKLFDELDSTSLQEALFAAMSAAGLAGSTDRYKS